MTLAPQHADTRLVQGAGGERVDGGLVNAGGMDGSILVGWKGEYWRGERVYPGGVKGCMWVRRKG